MMNARNFMRKKKLKNIVANVIGLLVKAKKNIVMSVDTEDNDESRKI